MNELELIPGGELTSPPPVGHNSGQWNRENADKFEGMKSREIIASAVQRIEKLEEEKQEVAATQKAIYEALKSQGFNDKVVRKIIALRKKNQEDLEEEVALTEIYLACTGDIDPESLRQKQADLFEEETGA